MNAIEKVSVVAMVAIIIGTAFDVGPEYERENPRPKARGHEEVFMVPRHVDMASTDAEGRIWMLLSDGTRIIQWPNSPTEVTGPGQPTAYEALGEDLNEPDWFRRHSDGRPRVK